MSHTSIAAQRLAIPVDTCDVIDKKRLSFYRRMWESGSQIGMN